MTRRRLGRWSSVAFSMASFVVTLLGSAIVIPWLLRFAYGLEHPHDASAGDAAGWALVISAPVLIPLIVVIAVAISAWVYHRARHPSSR
jgi:sterol desaturase/sphingolipid hydroxylase (fatty acid hydroxylase superfamily)